MQNPMLVPRIVAAVDPLVHYERNNQQVDYILVVRPYMNNETSGRNWYNMPHPACWSYFAYHNV